MRMLKLVLVLSMVAGIVPALGGCRSNAETGSLIGAGAGALGGYIIGNEMDKDDGYDHHRHSYRRY